MLVGELPAPVQRDELDQEREPVHRPPSRRTSAAVAFAVPPVAITSSTISTRWPGAHRIVVDLEAVGAVLERVGLA